MSFNLPSPFTYVYKTAPRNKTLCINVYGENTNGQPRPVVMFFHAGFLLAGSRDLELPIWLIIDSLKKHYIFLSVDFRCLSDVGIEDIVSDVKDAGKFVCEKLNKRLADNKTSLRIDPRKLIIAGSGSGAYLAALAATMYKPKPICFVSIYGMLDIASLTLRYSYKSEHEPILPTKHTPIGLVQFLTQSKSGAFQAKLCPKRSKLLKYTPLERVNETFPPSFLLHGIQDRIIPISDSEAFADKLEELSVEYNLLEVEDAGYAFDFYEMTDQQQKCLAMAIEWADLHVARFS